MNARYVTRRVTTISREPIISPEAAPRRKAIRAPLPLISFDIISDLPHIKDKAAPLVLVEGWIPRALAEQFKTIVDLFKQP